MPPPPGRDRGSETLITYLCRVARRCYWAIRWATWWPCRAAEIGAAQMNRFIRNRVIGACAGREEDRQPPAEWFDFEAERVKAVRRQEAAARRVSAQEEGPGTRFGEGAEPLFRALHSAVDSLLKGHVGSAETATVEDGRLVLRFRQTVNQQWLERRKSSVLGCVREVIPGFPDVRFELVREGGRG